MQDMQERTGRPRRTTRMHGVLPTGVVLLVAVTHAAAQCEMAAIAAPDGDANDYFGSAVALSADGRVALVGAWYDDEHGPKSGAAYVFVREGPGWVLETKLAASTSNSAPKIENSGVPTWRMLA